MGKPTTTAVSCELPDPDVHILTSGGQHIPAHSSVLASVSPVLESIVDRPYKHRSSEIIITITGVPCHSVSSFVRFLYSSRCTNEELEKFGIHLLALSHVFVIPQLKHRCVKYIGQQLTIEKVVDVLKLASLCDAPDLYVKCMKLISSSFESVQKTQGWKFLQEHDPQFELEILQLIDESESRKKRTRRHRAEQSLYMELSDAMECLEHICTEGCTSVGPYGPEPSMRRGPCNKFHTCQGLQLLIKHFALCEKRVNGGCYRCKSMWQLLRLHSSICNQPDSCGVPLCMQFKLKMQQVKKGDDDVWRVLVRKVIHAKAMSMCSLFFPERKREELRDTIQDARLRNFCS
ncbi:hypothetical protein K2173_001046 [Erythroxylum novogranatense]|uniref:BTB domain-containing protein n=1 Tax=Erythroxylum novogranatense TaxID=1862640 RepID=A0AAV8SII5_9ROSI|nr:hypothetical protein K2173_001046 [Erythroxylum novogranatense]